MNVVPETTGVVDPTQHEGGPPAQSDPYRRVLSAVRGLVRSDAAALLRLEGDVLVPVAVDGLSVETLGRRFPVGAHPRFARLLGHRAPLRFAPDCPLPDPYDGLVTGQPHLLAVHDCMGAAVHLADGPWGLITLDALQPGAFDGVTPQQLDAMVRVVESGIEAAQALSALQERAAHEQATVRAWQHAHGAPRRLLGASPAMCRLRDEIETVAPSDLTVLLLGETGVGKDLVAQRLHQSSGRSGRPLVQVNCAALPETLADSELFGHTRGAFTGAVQERTGKFELADGGTLFLDEVGELPLAIQAKLLRVLQSGDLQRPGSDRLRRVDVRVIAATNRDLREAIREGRFRADLYHRLAVYPLLVPPLRERGRDALMLAGAFLEENQHRLGARNLRLTPAAKTALLAHAWPGNVRELEHTLSRAALRALSEQGRAVRWIAIEPRHLALEAGAETFGHGAAGTAAAPPAPAAAFEEGRTLRDATEAFQRRWIEQALERHGGRMSRAAQAAGMDRSNFHRLAQRLGVARMPPKPG